MKNLISTLCLMVLMVSIGTSQSGERLEAWADNFAYKFERFTERFAKDVEKSAETFEAIAEDLVYEFEEKIENVEFDIAVDGWGNDSDRLSKAYLGIHSDHISKRKAEKLGFQNRYGSYITKVVKNSAADKAGLRPFDYIYGVEEQRTSDNQDLSDILEDYEPGETVQVHFVRNGQSETIAVQLGAYNDFSWDDNGDAAFLGVSPSSSERSSDMDGVTINVVKNSTAEKIGIKSGDVIKSINGQTILDWDDVSTAISNLAVGEEVKIEVERDGSPLHFNGKIEAKAYDRGPSKEVAEWTSERGEREDWDLGGGAFLGVYIEKISQKKAEALGFDNPYGSYVSGVIGGTAAEKAGLQPFDYIFGIDEYRVGENQDLGGILRNYEAGDKAVVHFYRKGNRDKKDIIFRTKPDYENSQKQRKNSCEDPFLGIIEMEKLNGQNGVRVKPVKNSTAEEIGLQESDVITHINGFQMYDWTDIGMAIDMLAPGDKIEVRYERKGDGNKTSGKIMSYAASKKCDDCDCGKKDMVFITPNDFKVKIPNYRIYTEDRSNSQAKVEIEKMDVQMLDVSTAEARDLESKGISLTASNDLKVKNLKMGPNPNIGMFELQFDLETEGQTTVNVYNPSGRAIYEYDLGRFSGDFSDYIDISQNGPGTYFLQIAQNGKSFVRKVVLKNK